jgi:hypothetical protein
MKSEEKSWSNELLKAHFQSLDNAWSDRNSVMLLLSEIRDYLGSESHKEDERARELCHRIEVFARNAATRVDRQPMKTAGKSAESGSSRKAV